MAMPRRIPVTEDQLHRFKDLKRLMPLLDRLHDTATARDKAGNRHLHYDQLIMLQLLYFFNPALTSMRGLIQASSLKKVQRELGVSPTSLGSFSEAGRVFDAELLKPIIAELGAQLQPQQHDPRLDDLPGRLLAVDGTEMSALAQLTDHMFDSRHLKLHTHFEPLTGVPVAAEVTPAKASETQNLKDRLLPNRVYVQDRGYACFTLLQAIDDIQSHFVCRVRDNSVYEVIQDRTLSDEDQAMGVVSDQVVRLGCASKRKELKAPVRMIRVACTPHRKRAKTGRGGPEQGSSLLIVTNLMDLPAALIALIYRHRWTIELFFRFLKHVLGCRHLLSHCKNGVTMQVYLAMIVCMLIALWTGRKPTLRTVEMIRFYFMGWAEAEEVEAHIAGLQPTAD